MPSSRKQITEIKGEGMITRYCPSSKCTQSNLPPTEWISRRISAYFPHFPSPLWGLHQQVQDSGLQSDMEMPCQFLSVEHAPIWQSKTFRNDCHSVLLWKQLLKLTLTLYSNMRTVQISKSQEMSCFSDLHNSFLSCLLFLVLQKLNKFKHALSRNEEPFQNVS